MSEVGHLRQKSPRQFSLGLPQHPKSGHGFIDFSSATPAASTIAVALLDADEALVVIDLGEKSYVWVITKDRPDWKEVRCSPFAEDSTRTREAIAGIGMKRNGSAGERLTAGHGLQPRTASAVMANAPEGVHAHALVTPLF
jgi:hypothetical protein